MRSRPEEAEEDKEGRQILFHFGWCGAEKSFLALFIHYSEFQALQLSSGELQMAREIDKSTTSLGAVWLLLEVGWGTWLVWVLSGVKKGERRRSTQALFAFTDRRTLAIKGTHADDEDDYRPHICH